MDANRQVPNLGKHSKNTAAYRAAEGTTPTEHREETIRFGQICGLDLVFLPKSVEKAGAAGVTHPSGVSGVVPGPAIGPLLKLEPLPPSPTKTSTQAGGLSPERGAWHTPKAVGAKSRLSSGCAGSGPPGLRAPRNPAPCKGRAVPGAGALQTPGPGPPRPTAFSG